jgi:hypothetical protein
MCQKKTKKIIYQQRQKDKTKFLHLPKKSDVSSR